MNALTCLDNNMFLTEQKVCYPKSFGRILINSSAREMVTSTVSAQFSMPVRVN